MTYKPYPTYTFTPKCECGSCLIRVQSAHSEDYEVVSSGGETVMAFVEAEISVKDGCGGVDSVNASGRGLKVIEE